MKLFVVFLTLLSMCFAEQGAARAKAGSQPDALDDPQLIRTQREAMIKADHKRNVEDAEALVKLAEELKSDLEKEDPHVISVRSIKKTEDIEKLAKSIRGRLKRY
jgi:hypothetical protein